MMGLSARKYRRLIGSLAGSFSTRHPKGGSEAAQAPPPEPAPPVKPPVMNEISVKIHGDPQDGILCGLVSAAFMKALALESGLPAWILDMRGMSGRKYRRFINNLVGSIPDARYLEVGSWAGSTACSAMHGNKVKVTCIDNWSEFGGPKEEFLRNVAAARTDGVDFRFIEQDFRAVDFKNIGTYNVYLFDGPHRGEDQYDGIALARDALDDEFVLIVDDWNYPPVRPATMAAIESNRLKVVYSIEILSSQDGGHPEIYNERSPWHNGYFLSVLKKCE